MNAIKKNGGRGESLYTEQTGRFLRLSIEKPEDALLEYGFTFIYSIDESDSATFLKNIGVADNSWRQRFLETVASHRRGKLTDAEKQYKSLLEEEPKNKEIEYNLAALYLQKGEIDLAVKHLEKFDKFVSSIKDEEYKAIAVEYKERISELKQEIEAA